MRARKNGETDDVDVFLEGSRSNHRRGLPQARIDDFHARIAQRARNYLGAAVVAVQPGLRNQNPYLFFRHGLGDGDFLVGAENVAHGVANFSQRCVGLHGIEDVKHEILVALGGVAQRAKPAVHLGLRTLGAEFSEALRLAPRDRLVNRQELQRLSSEIKSFTPTMIFSFFFLFGFVVFGVLFLFWCLGIAARTGPLYFVFVFFFVSLLARSLFFF